MGLSPQAWRDRAADLTYPNSKSEREYLKAGERVIREKSKPIVQAAIENLHEIHLQADELAEQTDEATAQAKETLQAAERRELTVAELRKQRDRALRAEILTEQTLEELRASIQFATYRRDKPDDYLGKLVDAYPTLDLDLPT